MAEHSDPNHASLTYKTIWTKFPDMRFSRDTLTQTWFCMNILTANVGWTRVCGNRVAHRELSRLLHYNVVTTTTQLATVYSQLVTGQIVTISCSNNTRLFTIILLMYGGLIICNRVCLLFKQTYIYSVYVIYSTYIHLCVCLLFNL